MKNKELADHLGDLMHALQARWLSGNLRSSAYAQARLSFGVTGNEPVSLPEWREIVFQAFLAEREDEAEGWRSTTAQLSSVIDRQRAGRQPAEYLGMERNFPEMQQVLEAERAPDGTIIHATDTGKRLMRDGLLWREIPSET